MNTRILAVVMLAGITTLQCAKNENANADKDNGNAAGSGFSVSATVSGLTGTGLVLTLNSATDIAVSANGTVSVAGSLANSATYAVTVRTQPVNPNQICAVANGSGTIAGANVTNIAITCVAATWQQEAYVKPSNADANDQFGRAIAVDGDLMVVGAPSEGSNQNTVSNGATASTNNSLLHPGAAYVFRRTGGTWVQEAYLKASNAEAYDQFGASVAISNNVIAVGAVGERSNQTTITHGNSASADNSFANYAGAVYIFEQVGGNWAQTAYIKAANANNEDQFGHALAFSGDTLVVGAFLEDSGQSIITNGPGASADNSLSSSGAVYVYRRTSGLWVQEAYLKATSPGETDFFGYAIAISGDTIAVTASDDDSNQNTITNGSTANADNSLQNSGAVYVYRRSGVTWHQEAYIKASNADAQDLFGLTVGLSGDTMIVGTSDENSNQPVITNGSSASSDNSATYAGAAYVFRRNGTIWMQEAYLKPTNLEANDYFGGYVALSGDLAIVSSSGEDSNQTSLTHGPTASSDNSVSSNGAVYVFRRTGAIWAQEAYLKPPVARVNNQFGYSGLSISGDTVAVYAYGDSSNQNTITNGPTASSDTSMLNAGAVHVFRLK